MCQRLCGFLVVFLLMFNGKILGQVRSPTNFFPQPKTIHQMVGRNNYEFKEWAYKASPSYVKNTVFNAGNFPFPLVVTHNYSSIGDPVVVIRNVFHLGARYYTESLGFFCQKELQIQKITSLPFRFRLGSLEYVNWMERKPNAVKPFSH